MSTDKDALREKAREWLRNYGLQNQNADIDSLTALLTASVADAVAQEREAFESFVRIQSHNCGPAEVDLADNILACLRARTPTPTPEGSPTGSPSPTEGRVPLPSGEQPGVGELVEAAQDLLAALSGIYLEGYSDQKERLAASKDRLYALIARARQQGSPSASQPRADYDAGENGEKI